MRNRWLAPIVVFLLFTAAQAQIRGGGGGSSVGNVHIHVILGNDRNAGPYLLIHLMQGSSADVVATGYTNDIGETDFIGVPVGDYHVEVSGDGIQTTESDTFEVDNRKVTQAQYVTVKKTEESGPTPVSAHSAMVSAADLKVPDKARKELDKANQAMALHDWKKSKEHLDKALAIDPSYVTAYNNLGVLYAKMDDVANEEQALKKAVGLDEHFAPALLNYAKLSIRQKNFPQAESLLQREVSVDPDNPESLLLLADAQYMNRHFEAAIVSADKAHSASPQHASFVHYIAARAYQQQNRQQDALAEFQTFLKEEPKGPRADHVRGDIARIQGASQQATAQ
ncbi:MAG TPA: tetratricopeptide repeat protein [Terriglobales bacterium]|nr:tetratricopeptide repeat protein [Terriglobales bacterium]